MKGSWITDQLNVVLNVGILEFSLLSVGGILFGSLVLDVIVSWEQIAVKSVKVLRIFIKILCLHWIKGIKQF